MVELEVAGENTGGGVSSTTQVQSLRYSIDTPMGVHHLNREMKITAWGGGEDIKAISGADK